MRPTADEMMRATVAVVTTLDDINGPATETSIYLALENDALARDVISSMLGWEMIKRERWMVTLTDKGRELAMKIKEILAQRDAVAVMEEQAKKLRLV